MAVTPSRPRGRPPTHNRSELLEAAAAVVVERGYEGLRYQDVSQATGVPIASLRHYFPSVDGLRKEALVHQVRAEMRTMTEVLDQGATPWESVEALIDFSLGNTVMMRKGWLAWMEFWRAAGRDHALVEDVREVEDAWRERTRQLLERGVESGDFTLDQSATDAARELMMIIDGAGPWLVIDTTEENFHNVRRRVARAMRRLLGVSEPALEREVPGPRTADPDRHPSNHP